ncbi:MAG TPA: FtsX-like permease family protein, partial [Microcella sp.]|nr:FtsX-like permease family protein [Microcella sp.]
MSEGVGRPARPPLRIALRLAARNARRSLGRSILIVAMMAIPVAGMSATAVVVASSNPTDQELVDLHFADATAILQVAGPSNWDITQGSRTPVGQYFDLVAPPGAESEPREFVDPRDAIEGRVLAVTEVYLAVQAGDTIRQTFATAGDVFIPELDGRYTLLEGRAPSSDAEIVLTPPLADDLQVSVGDSVTVLPDKSEATVVGLGRSMHADDATLGMFGSEALFGIDTNDPAALERPLFYALDATLTWDDVLALNEQGIVATSPEIILGDGPYPGALPDEYFGDVLGFQSQFLALAALIGGFLLVQVILLAGAAFLVGARQQQRALAVVASVGAENRLLRSVVTTNGVVLGMLGAVLGTGLGIGAGALVMELTRTGSALQYPGFHLNPWLLGGTALSAVAAGWVAAAIPARVATRVDIVAALRGARRPAVARRGAKRVATAIGLLGALSAAGGAVGLAYVRTLDAYPPQLDALFVIAIGGGAVALQGAMVLALPSVLRLIARRTERATTAVRLATRDTSRNSGRTVPVAAAVMTTVFLSSFLLTAMGGVQLDSEEGWTWTAPPNSITVAARTTNELTGETSIRDDLDELAAGVADIADAPATIVNGVPTITTWGSDPLTGEPTIPEQGTTTLIVDVDPSQVCPLSDPFRDTPVGTDFDEWYEQSLADPRCADRANQDSALNTSWDIADTVRVGTISELEAAIGQPLSSAAREALSRGDAVALRPEYVADGVASLRWLDSTQIPMEGLSRDQSVREDRVDAVVQTLDVQVPGALLMSPETAEGLGLEPTPGVIIAHPPFTAGA